MARKMTHLIIDTLIAATVMTVRPFGSGLRGHTAPKFPEPKG